MTDDKERPKRNYFKVPANYYELSEKEQFAFLELIANTLQDQAKDQEKSDNKKEKA